MNEKVFLLLLGCVVGLVTSLPLSPSLQMLLPEMNDVDKDTLSLIKEVLKKAEPATKDEGSEVPEGIFSKIIDANKDIDTAMYGGDILLQTGRSAMKCTSCLWPKNANGTVLVPYVLSTEYSPEERYIILNAMEEYETLTCVRFVPHTAENNYVNIARSSGCNSFLGKIGGGQPVSLGGGCIARGIVQHELNHALGFYHEHMRSDRDNFVTIMYQFIAKGNWGNFAKANTNNLGLEYDYDSVMHYDGYAFSNTSNQRSIVPKPDPNVPIGQRHGLSTLDVSKMNRLYQCSVCATLLNNNTGVFTSANYPSAYPNNVNCVWLIRTPSGQATLTFNGFDVQSSPDCTSDFMRIYDGPTKNSAILLDKLCGSLTIPLLIASTSQMLVEFVSDGALAGVGFKATYSSVQCGGNFFHFQGNFSSPGYPKAYGSNMDCTYTITAPDGYRVALTIWDFHLELSRSCMYDYLTIFVDGAKMGPYCSNVYDAEITSIGNSMVLVFHSDSYNVAKGFTASYTFI